MELIEGLKESLAKTIRNYNGKGWSPATSTNYSFRQTDKSEEIYVSRSGVDKSCFTSSDFIQVDRNGNATKLNPNSKPSAETLIHCVIYDLFPKAKVILHSHSIYPVLVSKKMNEHVSFEGFEIQKGFAGQVTHDSEVNIPIFENSQDMDFFVKALNLRKEELIHSCFLIKQHGTYAWGENLFEAKRHLETLEYLCQCKWMDK
ncbi:methylthioribulose 1-phosphate dehydratase [Crocinitomicaceae bacterium]|nr:methylthioribulose 1-phosphate dehydratase [Crocinitomicaceae bacterium]